MSGLQNIGLLYTLGSTRSFGWAGAGAGGGGGVGSPRYHFKGTRASVFLLCIVTVVLYSE